MDYQSTEFREAVLALGNPRERTDDFVKHIVLPNLERWTRNDGIFWHLCVRAREEVELLLYDRVNPYPPEGFPEAWSAEFWDLIEACVVDLESGLRVVAASVTLTTDNAVGALRNAWQRMDALIEEQRPNLLERNLVEAV